MTIKEVPRIILHGDLEEANLRVREGIRQLNILKNLMGFQRLDQDVRRVRYTDGSEITCRSIFGIDDVQIYVPKRIREKPKVERYVYVTISCYVTIWDLQTGEVAEIPGIIFPCHRDKLKDWLKGCKKVPTRQWLKDNPKHGRDYLEDNKVDAGNESRLISSSVFGFGLPQGVAFTHIVKDDVFDCSTCPDPPEVVADEIIWDGVYTPSGICNCFWDKTTERDRPGGSLDYKDSWQKQYMGDWYSQSRHRCRDVSVNVYHGFVPQVNNMVFLERWIWRCKYLPLNAYGSKGWTDSEVDKITCALTKMKYEVTHRDSAFGYIYYGHRITRRMEGRFHAYVMSYKTVLGDLILDLTPVRKLRDIFANLNDYQPLNVTLRNRNAETWVSKDTKFEETYLSDSYVENFINVHIEVNNLSSELGDYLKNSFPLSDPEHIYTFPSFDIRLPHAGFKRAVYKGSGDDPGGYTQYAVKAGKSMGKVDVDDRLAVSWCECPEKYGWYKVRLFFYTGRVEYSKLEQLYCPANAKHMNMIDWCNDGKYSKCYIGNRFSSVQATIELEHPEEYKKENTSIPGKPGWVKRYRRPEDYSGLCAFPDRECGYPEDGDYCYPFDGTYDIYTLGEAVEELINNCYKDGSDDQLIVYLLEREIKR